MPVHRCLLADLEDKVAEIEALGETVISVTRDGEAVAIVTDASKRSKPGEVEKR